MARPGMSLFWKIVLLIALMGQCQSQSLYEGDANVAVVTKKSAFDEILKSDGVWMVQFYAPWCGHCQKLAPEFKALGKIYKDIVKLAAVDATSTFGKRIASTYQVEGFPSLFIFGNDKKKPQKYEGGRDAQSMAQALANAIVQTVQDRATGGGASTGGSSQQKSTGGGPSKVVQLTAANFDEKVLKNPLVSMVAFIAPWCGHCQKLLPEWDEASRKIDGEGAFLGVVDATVEETLAARFGVKGYPTIKVFPGGLDHKSDFVDYPGERVASAIVRYILGEVDRTGVPKEIPELTGKDVLDASCQGHNRICVLAALPHILDSGAAGRNKYRDMLASVAKGFRGSAYQFLWFEGGSQSDLEQSLEMTFGYPALVALSLDRQAYALQHGSFSEKAISSFLHSITTGRQPTIKLSNIPEIVTVEPWDGQDGAPLEDEIPLSEIMGDDEF
jgi:protein disulfide-isomerase A6